MVADRSDSAAYAQAAAAAAGMEPPPAQGLIVSTSPLGDSEVVICLVDKAQQRLAVYVADAKRSRLKLIAVRDIAADWALTDYNNDPPLPKDIRARVEKWQESARPTTGAETPKP